MFWPALLLLLLIAAASVLRAPRLMLGAAPDPEPRCGKCAYIVRGISTLTCPECGSDLREVGISTGRTSQSPWSPFLFVATLWSLAVFMATALIAGPIREITPRRGTATHTVLLTGPASGAFQSLSFVATGDYRTGTSAAADPFEPAALVQLFLNDGRIASLNADVGRATYTYRSPASSDVSASGELDGKVILSWMKDAGIDTTLAGVTREAVEIVTHLRAPPPNRSRHSYSSSRSGSNFGAFQSGRETWNTRPTGIFWGDILPPALALILWAAGMRRIARHLGIWPARGRAT